MEAVQRKVTSAPKNPPRRDRSSTMSPVHRRDNHRVQGPRHSPPPRLHPLQSASQPRWHLTRSRFQATASNHKVVTDCHSQIAVSEPCCFPRDNLTDVFGPLLFHVSFLSNHPSRPSSPPVPHSWCRDIYNAVRHNFRLASSVPAFASTRSLSTSHGHRPSHHSLFAVCIRRAPGTSCIPRNASTSHNVM